ncbi:MAG TPA: hypothetical protein VEC18_08220 [Myxococcota bacterium]|nr:hypothetical protein [Myxococcota bacterium]
MLALLAAWLLVAVALSALGVVSAMQAPLPQLLIIFSHIAVLRRLSGSAEPQAARRILG